MKRNKFPLIFSITVTVLGLFLVVYPIASIWWNSMNQSRSVMSYSEEVEQLSEEEYDSILNHAKEYNQTLLERDNQFELTEQQVQIYPSTLQVGASQAIGYLEIPSIHVSVPICHGTDGEALKTMVGHLEWTSLPIGGESSHSVIAGHRGLPSAKLFSDLDELRVRDIFVVRVLNETMTYEVDQIKIVDPEEGSDLLIEEGKDYCTLLTCTPYGVNTHRLLVRGHRIPNRDESMFPVLSEASQIEPLVVAPVVGIPLFLLLLIFVRDKSRGAQNWEDYVHADESAVENLRH